MIIGCSEDPRTLANVVTTAAASKQHKHGVCDPGRRTASMKRAQRNHNGPRCGLRYRLRLGLYVHGSGAVDRSKTDWARRRGTSSAEFAPHAQSHASASTP